MLDYFRINIYLLEEYEKMFCYVKTRFDLLFPDVNKPFQIVYYRKNDLVLESVGFKNKFFYM